MLRASPMAVATLVPGASRSKGCALVPWRKTGPFGTGMKSPGPSSPMECPLDGGATNDAAVEHPDQATSDKLHHCQFGLHLGSTPHHDRT